jgi:Zn-dependent protease
MQGINSIFYVIVLIMSVVVHEVAHGIAADAQGDKTARFAGRLSLNPLRHIDLWGSIILPFLLVIMHAGFVIGWAKPVPYIESNLRNKRFGTAIVACAGILANFSLAVIFGLAIRLAPLFGAGQGAFITIASAISIINLLLGFFNLIPIPPLDGSKILFSFLGVRGNRIRAVLEYASLPILFLFIFFVWPYLFGFIAQLFTYIAGIALPLV